MDHTVESHTSREYERQSPMKNLEVIFSLLELKFKCKNLLLIWGKHPGAIIRWSHSSYVTHLQYIAVPTVTSWGNLRFRPTLTRCRRPTALP